MNILLTLLLFNFYFSVTGRGYFNSYISTNVRKQSERAFYFGPYESLFFVLPFIGLLKESYSSFHSEFSEKLVSITIDRVYGGQAVEIKQRNILGEFFLGVPSVSKKAIELKVLVNRGYLFSTLVVSSPINAMCVEFCSSVDKNDYIELYRNVFIKKEDYFDFQLRFLRIKVLSINDILIGSFREMIEPVTLRKDLRECISLLSKSIGYTKPLLPEVLEGCVFKLTTDAFDYYMPMIFAFSLLEAVFSQSFNDNTFNSLKCAGFYFFSQYSFLFLNFFKGSIVYKFENKKIKYSYLVSNILTHSIPLLGSLYLLKSKDENKLGKFSLAMIGGIIGVDLLQKLDSWFSK